MDGEKQGILVCLDFTFFKHFLSNLFQLGTTQRLRLL